MDIDLSMFSDCNDINKNVVDYNDINKNVVDYLAIKIDISRKDNIYYTILYRPVDSKQTYEGYGTSKPHFIKEWLEKYFIVKKD